MIKKTPEVYRREIFLKRFDLTAQEAFGGRWQHRGTAAQILTQIARAHFRTAEPEHQIYRELSVIWRNMGRRKKDGWHGNIDTVEADFE